MESETALVTFPKTNSTSVSVFIDWTGQPECVLALLDELTARNWTQEKYLPARLSALAIEYQDREGDDSGSFVGIYSPQEIESFGPFPRNEIKAIRNQGGFYVELRGEQISYTKLTDAEKQRYHEFRTRLAMGRKKRMNKPAVSEDKENAPRFH